MNILKTSKWVGCLVWELYLNKAVFFKLLSAVFSCTEGNEEMDGAIVRQKEGAQLLHCSVHIICGIQSWSEKCDHRRVHSLLRDKYYWILVLKFTSLSQLLLL